MPEGQEGSREGSGQVGSMYPGQLCEVPQCRVLAGAGQLESGSANKRCCLVASG